MRLVIALALLLLVVGVVGMDVAAGGICQRDRDRICDPDICPNCNFVDEDGDGICDNCGTCICKGPDDDGDGIPNGQDPDYSPPKDGSGRRR